MHNVRIGHAASVLPNGKVLIAGGCNGSVLKDAELYDPAAGTWTVTNNMNIARSLHTASLLPNGKVLVTGGLNISANQNGANSCDVATIMFRRRDRVSYLNSKEKVLVDAKENTSSVINTAELYDPSTGTWTTTGSMTFGRAGHTASVLPDGRVLVVGGVYGWSLQSAELYDPSTGTWSNTSLLNYPRIYHKTILLTNGKILVTGGVFDISQDKCELYDPSTDVWNETGRFNYRRVYHELVGLPDGKALMIGGRFVDF